MILITQNFYRIIEIYHGHKEPFLTIRDSTIDLRREEDKQKLIENVKRFMYEHYNFVITNENYIQVKIIK